MNTHLIRRITTLALAALTSLPLTALGAKSNAVEERATEAATRHLAAQRAAMGLPAATEFAVRRAESDPLGQTHVRVDQLYRGVPVFGGELIVHVEGATGRVLSTTDDAKRNLSVDTTPSLTAGHALAIANREVMPLNGYSAEPTARLEIFQDEETGATALVWHVHTEVESRFETRHDDFMVDAKSGKVLDHWDSLETAGTGNSQYSGTVSLATSGTGPFTLVDATGNKTTNLNHATSGTGTTYSDTDNTWGDGANYVEGSSTTAANGQTAAVDAHFGMSKTLDYYLNVHGRNGIDGAGTATTSRVHYSNSYDNAFWSDSCFCMTYGDGSSFTTLTSLDVAGHEMSHGVCSRTANLAYRKESGGLNEGNSDIFGTMVEFYARGGTGGNWTIGEQLSSKPLRYMYKPSLDGRSPDCWSSSVGRLDVHYSSGIANRFFYFLANGTTSLSGASCNGTTFSGVGNSAAERIWYRALTVYMTSSTTYAGARTATISAATDIFGAASSQVAAVKAAWSGVNVN